MKKRNTVLALVVTSGLLLAGCGGAESSAKDSLKEYSSATAKMMNAMMDASYEVNYGDTGKAEKRLDKQSNSAIESYKKVICSKYADDAPDGIDPDDVYELMEDMESVSKLRDEKELKDDIKRSKKSVDSKLKSVEKAIDKATFTELSDEEAVLESDAASFKKMIGDDSVKFVKEDGDWKLCEEPDIDDFLAPTGW